MAKKKFNIWEGIYETFEDAPRVGSGFSGHTWSSRSLAKMTAIIKLAKEKRVIPEFVVYRENLLPILIALISKKKKLKIVDFGGNLGQEYLSILESTNLRPEKIKYTVVEGARVCAIGTKLFKGKKGIEFRTILPQANAGADVIHIGSTLQYIENWKKYNLLLNDEKK